MRSYLVVANQTLGGQHVLEKVRELLGSGECRFHILVPATPPTEHLTWTEGGARAIAQDRLERALKAFRNIGAEVTGEVGDPNPMHAILDAVRAQPFDEVILSTLPPGMSRWLRADLPHRVGRAIGYPVTHMIAQPDRVQAR